MIIKQVKTYFRATEKSSLNPEEVEGSNNVQKVGDPTHTAREFLMQRKRTKEKINLYFLTSFQSFALVSYTNKSVRAKVE